MAAHDEGDSEPDGLQAARQYSAVEPQKPALEQQGESLPHLFVAEQTASAC